MFIMSCGESGDSGITVWLAVLDSKSDMNGVVACRVEVSVFPNELSTRTRFRKEETVGDFSVSLEVRSGIISFKSGMLSLGGLNASFVSVPMIK